MSAERKDGGSAFPLNTSNVNNPGAFEAEPGMSLRDYFIAHAPHEPQRWFEPVMPPEPVVPDFEGTSGELREDLGPWAFEGCDPATDEGRAWVEAHDAAEAALKAWRAERQKQRYVQWPAAWADAMLAAREGGAL